MIGLDTNILVRYLTQDHAIQSPIATDLIENRLSEHELGFVTTVALAETIWVLERAYELNAAQIAGALTRLLQVGTLMVESEAEVFQAMVAVQEGQGRFADVLIGALAAKSGCLYTVTFDKKALRLAGFRSP
jgi:predicted nucleic-acid-binding protein